MKKMKLSGSFVFASVFLALHSAAAFASTIQAQLLAAGAVELETDTVTVPLHHGRLRDGRGLFYVLIDASDETIARSLGLVYAPALQVAASAKATRTAFVGENGEWVFDHGTVSFSSQRTVVPGATPNLFPPESATPGSLGSEDYSPYVTVNGVVYNAPIVAFDVPASALSVDHSRVHDKVVAFNEDKTQVTLALSHGYSDGKPLVYVSLEANDPTVAAMEGATYAPALNELKQGGASIPLFAVTNGETGKNNPMRQGLDSALAGDGSPLNVLTGIPTLSLLPYSPLWDLHVAQWTPRAVSSKQRSLLTSAQEFERAFSAGLLTGIGGGSLSSSGLLVNCPAIAILR